MIVTITGIKSKKTLNKIEKKLRWHCYVFRVTGSEGNYQVHVHTSPTPRRITPVEALEIVYREITNLTDDHKANLKWKVSK